MKHIAAFTLALSAFALFCGSKTAHAQTSYFPNDAIINDAVSGDAEIGLDSSLNPSSPTVSLIAGGNIGGVADANNASVFNVMGGSIGNGIRAFQFSTVNISGGSILGEVDADNFSIINLSGGSIDGNLVGGSKTGHFNFYGVDLAASLFDPGDPTDPDNVLLYHLSGTLGEGTVLTDKNLYVESDDQFTITNTPAGAVPEPGGVALLSGLGVTGVGLLLRRRKR